MNKLTPEPPHYQPKSPENPLLTAFRIVLREGGSTAVRRLVSAIEMALVAGTIILATGLAVALAIRLT